MERGEDAFPRLTNRGLIEATRSLGSKERRLDFRGWTTAASLKPVAKFVGSHVAPTLPRLQTAAPLKLSKGSMWRSGSA